MIRHPVYRHPRRRLPCPTWCMYSGAHYPRHLDPCLLFIKATGKAALYQALNWQGRLPHRSAISNVFRGPPRTAIMSKTCKFAPYRAGYRVEQSVASSCPRYRFDEAGGCDLVRSSHVTIGCVRSQFPSRPSISASPGLISSLPAVFA